MGLQALPGAGSAPSMRPPLPAKFSAVRTAAGDKAVTCDEAVDPADYDRAL